jgi:hypothetical protein
LGRPQRLVLLVAGALALGVAPLGVASAQESDGPSPYESSVEPTTRGSPVIADVVIAPREDKPYIGDGIYNATGEGQTITKNASPGETKRFITDVNNDGESGPNRFYGSGSAKASCFRVRYIFKGVNLTQRITRGGRGFLDASLPPGTSELVIKVRVKGCAPKGSSNDATLNLGPSDGIPFDRVVARVNVVKDSPAPL